MTKTSPSGLSLAKSGDRRAQAQLQKPLSNIRSIICRTVWGRDRTGIIIAATRSMILSINPRYARDILSGRKTVELRRTRPDLVPGALAFIYASSPTKSVIGVFCIEKIITAPLELLWDQTNTRSCITYQEFLKYYSGTSKGHALVISGVKSLRIPISLEFLRSVWPGFQPPRSYYYVVPGDEYARRLFASIRRSFDSNYEQKGTLDHGANEIVSANLNYKRVEFAATFRKSTSHKRLYLKPGSPFWDLLKGLPTIRTPVAG